jgi:hypothetical protein
MAALARRLQSRQPLVAPQALAQAGEPYGPDDGCAHDHAHDPDDDAQDADAHGERQEIGEEAHHGFSVPRLSSGSAITHDSSHARRPKFIAIVPSPLVVSPLRRNPCKTRETSDGRARRLARQLKIVRTSSYPDRVNLDVALGEKAGTDVALLRLELEHVRADTGLAVVDDV